MFTKQKVTGIAKAAYYSVEIRDLALRQAAGIAEIEENVDHQSLHFDVACVVIFVNQAEKRRFHVGPGSDHFGQQEIVALDATMN